MKTIRAGFTLVELMIVIAIMAILAAIAIPQYQDYIIRSKVTEAVFFAEAYKTPVADYFFSNGRMPLNNSAAGILPSNQIISTYVTDVAIVNGIIIVTVNINGIRNPVNTMAGQNKIAFYPTATTSGMNWVCGKNPPGIGFTSILPKYRPITCK